MSLNVHYVNLEIILQKQNLILFNQHILWHDNILESELYILLLRESSHQKLQKVLIYHLSKLNSNKSLQSNANNILNHQYSTNSFVEIANNGSAISTDYIISLQQSPIAINTQSNVIQYAIYQQQIQQMQQQYQLQPQIQQTQINKSNINPQINTQLQQLQFIQQQLLLKQKEWAEKYYKQFNEIQLNNLAYTQLQALFQEQLEQHEALNKLIRYKLNIQLKILFHHSYKLFHIKQQSRTENLNIVKKKFNYIGDVKFSIRRENVLIIGKNSLKKQKKDLSIKSVDSQKLIIYY